MPLLANSEDFLVAVVCLVKDGYAQSFRSQRGTLSNAEVLVEPEGVVAWPRSSCMLSVPALFWVFDPSNPECASNRSEACSPYRMKPI